MLTKADLQRLRSLREKKSREELGRFVVEGEKVIAELLTAGFAFEAVYATPAWPAGGDRPPLGPAVLVEITPEEMARASHFPTPACVLAVGRITHPPLAAGALDHGLTLALDGVQDAGNVGTLLRIADWFAFDRVVLSPDCADVFHQKVINASMGSFARVRTHTTELAIALAELKASAATPILGCDLGGKDVRALTPLADAVVVIGSEGRGLSPAIRPSVTDYVTIPRHGGAESLNAGVAAGIICHQLRRPA